MILLIANLTLLSIGLSFALVLIAMTDNSLIYAQSNTTLVNAGVGNETDIKFTFDPQNVEIKAGESVSWHNPNFYAEPHSVTFLKDKKYFADFAMPFRVANSTEFEPVDPNSNSEPLFIPLQPGEMKKTLVSVNARAFMPTVIDSSGNKVTYLQPNSNYTMDGTESYVNSGWLWPEGKAPPGPAINNFTLTFQTPGTYSYLCNVHPWMAGSVLVK